MKKLLLILVVLLCAISYSQNNPQWIIYNTTNSNIPSNTVNDIVIDGLNRKWISFNGAGILKIDSASWTLYNTGNSNIPTNSFQTINVDNDFNFWGGIGSLITKFDGVNWYVYGTPDTIPPGHSISSIVFDSLNNVWLLKNLNVSIGSPHYLMQFKEDSIWSTHLSLGLANGYRQLLIDNQSILIGDGEGLYLFENDSLQYFQPQYGPIGLYVTDIKADAMNNIWLAVGLGGWGGLVKFDELNYSSFNYSVIAIEFDKDGNLWAGTHSYFEAAELLKFDGTNWTSYNSINSQFPQTFGINDLAFDNYGNLWIGTMDAGLIIFNENGIVPVELVSFSLSVIDNDVILSWQTATETNNSGFEILKKKSGEGSQESEWENIGFVPGHGTTTETQYYSFTDNQVNPGKYQYRLKQVDYNGTFEYSKTIEVEVNSPTEFSLEQNYPNPFNPSTKISWQSPVGSWQTLKIYDVLGNEVATLVNEYKPAGTYEVNFNGHSDEGQNLSSGIYFYQLKAGDFVQTKKMMLMK